MRIVLALLSLVFLAAFSMEPVLVPAILLAIGAGFLMRHSRMPARAAPPEWPSVSIIVPARNEERTLPRALESLSSLDYPSLEILVIDDRSTDATRAVAKEFLAAYAGSAAITLLEAPSHPPEGWVGKTYAADYAIRQSKGALILVCDADVLHAPQSLKTSVAHFMAERAALLSRPPYLEVRSAGEYPLLLQVFILKLSSWLSRTLGSTQSFAMGTYLMFTREFYERAGGWAAHRSFPESLPLLNFAQTHNEHFVFMDDDYKEVTTRMYEGARMTVQGMVRNMNFALLQPLPFALSFFIFAATGNAFAQLLRGDLGGAVTLAVFAFVFGMYLHASGYTLPQSLQGAALSPILLIVIYCTAAMAALRQVLPLALEWRGRLMKVQ